MAKKRANGEGNIRKRKDGRWEGDTLPDTMRKPASELSRAFSARHRQK